MTARKFLSLKGCAADILNAVICREKCCRSRQIIPALSKRPIVRCPDNRHVKFSHSEGPGKKTLSPNSPSPNSAPQHPRILLKIKLFSFCCLEAEGYLCLVHIIC